MALSVLSLAKADSQKWEDLPSLPPLYSSEINVPSEPPGNWDLKTLTHLLGKICIIFPLFPLTTSIHHAPTCLETSLK